MGHRLFFWFPLALSLLSFGVSALATEVVFRDPSELTKLPAPVVEWYRMETRLLSKSMRPGVFAPIHQNTQRQEFTPEAARVFELNAYWIPEDELKIYESAHTPDLLGGFHRTRNGRNEVLFLIHPESENYYAKLEFKAAESEKFLAAATASSRSLLVWQESMPSKPFVAKLSLDAIIATTDRTISGKETAASIGVDRILGQMYDLPPSFSVFHEEFGAIPKGMERGGMILRSFPSVGDPNRLLVPFFSIAMTPADGSLPLALRMAKATGKDPRRFIIENIIEPFVEQWATLAIDHGVLMEPHGQNILLEVGSDLRPTGRIVHRDFGGFNIDLNYVREQYRLNPADLPIFSGSIAENYYQDAHRSNMQKSISTYFGDGVLYSYEKEWPDWVRKGWVSERDAIFPAKEIMRNALERVLSRRSGTHVQLDTRFAGLPDVITNLRKLVVKPTAVRKHCSSILKALLGFLRL